MDVDVSTEGVHQGYPVEIIEGGVDKKYLCCCCGLLLREPMQNLCGHRFCKPCVQQITKDVTEATCPACQEENIVEEYSMIKEGNIFPDNAMKREFLKWRAVCINPGCDWRGTFKEYENHINNCPFQSTICECGRRIRQSELEQHKNTDCLRRKVVCHYCEQTLFAADEKMHLKSCPKVMLSCHDCGKEMMREDLSKHYDDGQCTGYRISCPYGCGDFVDPNNQQEHEKHNIVDHVRCMNHRLQRVIQGEGEIHPSQPVQVANEIQDLRRKVEALEKKVGTRLGDTSAHGITGQSAHRSGGPSGSSNVSIDDINHKIQLLEEKIKVFTDAMENLKTCSDKNASNIDLSERNAEQLVIEMKRRMKESEKSLQLKELSTAELEQRIKTLEVSSYDGILMWKVTDISRKRQDAISGRTTSIYSPPFYTSMAGYKMCARMYLNGDGMGKGSHISLFFVIMRNDYDPLMRWPFRQKVTFILIDQNNRNHITDAFRPDPSSSSFRRPRSEMNIASGCPLFCPLSSLQSDQHAYIKDNTMYIKIIVDCSDM